MTGPVIQTSALVKRFGSVRALSGLDLSVPGGAVGLLGPNGAGKSTLLKLCLGLLVPDGGSAQVLGFDPSKRADRLDVRRAVGYMPESDCLMPGHSGVDLVHTLGRLSGLSADDAMARTHEVLDYVGLDEARYRECDQYSTGMKQRLKLAQALVHDPALLLLDEPTNGLDPAGRREMLELVHGLAHEQGKNLLFCSHLLPDVERTCDAVIVIHQGSVVDQGNIADMTSSEGHVMRVQFDGEATAFEAALDARSIRCELEGARGLRAHLPLEVEHADPLFVAAAEAGATITELTPVKSSLEEVFLRVLGEEEL